MNKKMLTKLVAMMLVFLLCFADVAILGNGIAVAASNVDLEKQSTEVKKTEVEFDAYFEEEGVRTHSKKIEPEEEEKLHLEIKVPEGYLTNAVIKIENANFKVQEITDEAELSLIQEISAEENTITLNKISNGGSVILEIPIKMKTDSSFNVKDISKIAEVKLQGTYVNNKGKEVEVDKAIEVESIMSGEAESMLTEEITKFVSFDVNGSKGVILQTAIHSKLVDNKLPVKSTTFEIEIPELNNAKPDVITISSNSTMATDGQGKRVFSEEDYEIEDGVLRLIIENGEESLSWLKDAEDELLLTCIFGEQTTDVQAQIELNAKTTITYYSDELKTVKAESSDVKELTGQIGDIVTLDLETNRNELYKGYIQTEGASNTEFVDTLSINVGYSKLVDKLLFKDETTYIDINENVFTSNSVYKYTKISKDNFIQLLGEEGYINVYKDDGTLVIMLNKDNLEYTYQEEYTNLMFETSAPIAEGVLEIENGRGIKSAEYSKEQIDQFAKYSVNLICNIFKDNQVIISAHQAKEMNLLESQTKAELILSQDRFSTVTLNEGVEVRINLKTTGEDSTLYKNPKVKLTFPEYVTNVSAENVKLLYEDQLGIKDAKIYKNEKNEQVVEINLIGEQTEYSDSSMTDEATLIMEADIAVNDLTPTKTMQAQLEVSNENDGQTFIEDKDVKFVAPVGMVTVNKIADYNEAGETAESMSGKTAIGKIDVNKESRTAKVTMTVVNNYNYSCENVKIIGKIPFEGNKSIKTNEELGSTFTTKMVKGINIVSGLSQEDITIYYSENGDADADLNKYQNGWTKDITDLSNVKAYMIVINEKVLQIGDTVSFDYEIEIPENLQHDEIAYSTFAVTYTRGQYENGENANVEGMATETTESTPVGVSTGEGPNLSVELNADFENEAVVKKGQVITYTGQVTNNGKLPVNNISLKVAIPSQSYLATYNQDKGEYDIDYKLKEKIFTIDTLEVGKSESIKFSLQVGSYSDIEKVDMDKIWPEKTLDDFEGSEEEFAEYQSKREEAIEEYNNMYNSVNKINPTVIATVEGFDDEFKSNERVNIISSEKDEVGLVLNLDDGRDSPELLIGEDVEIVLSIGKTNNEPRRNLVVKGVIPEGLTLDKYSDNAEYDEETRTLTYSYANMSDTRIAEKIQLKTDDMQDGVCDRTMKLQFEATYAGNDSTIKSNEKTYHAIDLVNGGFDVSQKSDRTDGYISIGEEITYEITIKNVTSLKGTATIQDIIPEELEVTQAYYVQKGSTNNLDVSQNNILSVTPTLESGESITIYVVAKAKWVSEDTEITNTVKIVGSTLSEKEGNSLKHTILGNSSSGNNGQGNNGNSGSGTDNEQSYRISGTAWIDANKNGSREDDEALVGNMTVYLLDDKGSNIKDKTTTNVNGVYVFLNVPAGTYIVAFEYDTGSYGLTSYQAKNVGDTINSDAVSMILKIGDSTKTYGATNRLTVNNNTYNMDIGLIGSPKFDLELEKTISLVQVSNAKGTENYNFNKTDLAKVEIPEKNLKGSVVAVTYIITVKNTGSVAGYANKIVDYKAKDMSFSSSLNPEWYTDTSGNVYTTSLSDKVIQPGEEVSVSLILTKTMTDDNIGQTTNDAEIAESSNDLGTVDMDSTPNNKSQKEDDFGTADFIVAVKTGGVLVLIGIMITVLAIFAFGAYEINKRVLSRI